MALLKTPLYLFTRLLAGPPRAAACERTRLRGARRRRRGEQSRSAGALLSFPRSARASPAGGKRREKRRPGNNGQRLEERQPRLRFLRPRRRPAPLPPLPAASHAALPGSAGRRRRGAAAPLSCLADAAPPCYLRQPLTGDPRSPLKSPRQACQFSAALPRAPADLLAQPLTPKLSRPTARSGAGGASGAARLARRQPRSRAYPGVGGAGGPAYGSPQPSAGCPRPPATGPAPARPLACREHYQQERRQHYRRAPTRPLQCSLPPFRGRCCAQKAAQHCSPP